MVTYGLPFSLRPGMLRKRECALRKEEEVPIAYALILENQLCWLTHYCLENGFACLAKHFLPRL